MNEYIRRFWLTSLIVFSCGINTANAASTNVAGTNTTETNTAVTNTTIGTWLTDSIIKRYQPTIDVLTHHGWDHSNSIVMHGMEKIYYRSHDKTYLTYVAIKPITVPRKEIKQYSHGYVGVLMATSVMETY